MNTQSALFENGISIYDTFFPGTSEKKSRNFWLIKVKRKYLSRMLRLGKKQWLRKMSVFKAIFCKVLWCLISNVFYGSVQKHQHSTGTGYDRKARATMILFPLFGTHSIDKSVFLTYWQSKPAIDRNGTEHKKTTEKNCVEQTASSAVKAKVIMRTEKHTHTHTPATAYIQKHTPRENVQCR